MGKHSDLFPVIEIQEKPRSYDDCKENIFNIDGKKVRGLRNVKIEFGIDFGYPIVTVEFYAKEIRGAVAGDLHFIKKD